MRKNKVISADEAIALVRVNDVLTTTGFVQSCIPEALHAALEKRFVETGSPRGLTLIMTAGAGDSKGLGTGRLHHPGLLSRVIAANFGRMPKVAQAAQNNLIRGYNLPQGVISQLYRACAAGQPGLFSKVGLQTYVDPRHGGAKVNDLTTEDIVKLVEVDGEEWLFYTATKIDVAFIRATSADPSGNLSYEKEALTLDCLAQAMAARNNGGIVIAQVERIVDDGYLLPKDVRVPGILVDCVVVAEPEMHRMNYGVMHDAALAGEIRVPVTGIKRMALNERKIIARRAAFELPPNGVVNLGVGAPEGISSIANEEKVTPYITLTTEAGAVGGVLASGSSFGAATNADCIIDQNQMFDFYDGGGLDMTCLGMAECDEAGNVNTSKFGGKLNGCGGFINISQNARTVVFAGTFTAGGLEIAVQDGHIAHRHRGQGAQVRQAGAAEHLLRPLRGAALAAGALRDGALRLPADPRGPGVDRGGARHRHRARYPRPHGLRPRGPEPGADGSAHLPRRADGADRRPAQPRSEIAGQLRRRAQHPLRQPGRLVLPGEGRHGRVAPDHRGGVSQGGPAGQRRDQPRRVPAERQPRR